MGKIKDVKKLKWMGVFLVSIGAILSTVWYFQGDPTWWIAIVAFSLFYGFIWMMAWILRNNP